MASSFYVLAAAGYAQSAIVVGIPNMNAENRERNLTPPFMRRNNDDTKSTLGEADSFLNFLETEAIPFITQRYSTNDTRLLVGHSRGGLLVTYSLIAKPRLFSGRICFSAPLWRQNGILINKLTEFLMQKDSLTSFAYFSAGELETEQIKRGMTDLISSFKHHSPIGLRWHGDTTKGATHQTNAEMSTPIAVRKWSEYVRGK